MRLEVRNLAADGRERNADPPGRGGKAARFDRSDEDRHGFEAIHFQIPEGFFTSYYDILEGAKFLVLANPAET
jgi:hypothetical protein